MFRPVPGYDDYELESLRRIEQDLLNQLKTCEEFKEYSAQVPGLRAELRQVQTAICKKSVSVEEQKAAPLGKPEVQEKIYYNPTHRTIHPKPIYEFDETQKKLMLEYLEKGDDLDCNATRSLIEKTMLDEMTYEGVNFSPASVISEGIINCRFEWLRDVYFVKAPPFVDSDIPKAKPHESFKHSPNFRLPCTIDDVVPCNALLKALHFLLERATRWHNGDDQEPARPILNKPDQKRRYTVLTEKQVYDLEKLYRRLPPSHQLIFNCIMRDETDQIMDRAVQLPSGDVCDQLTAETLLVPTSQLNVYEGHCPNVPEITFKLVRDENGKEVYSEIKPVSYYNHAVVVLKKIADEVEEIVVGQKYKALNNSDLSDERDRMIIKLSKLLDKIVNAPVRLTANQKSNANVLAIKQAQTRVLESAISSLRQVESKDFNETLDFQSSIPGQTYKTIKFGPDYFNDGQSTPSLLFRKAANCVTLIDEQFAYVMPTLVAGVQDLLKRCIADIDEQHKPEKQRECCYYYI